jgi:hypothetical protein
MKKSTSKDSPEAKKKIPKPVTQVTGRVFAETFVELKSANQFEAIRDERHVIRDQVAKHHVIVIEGVMYKTPSLGLDYVDLLSLVKRGLATGEKPTYEREVNSEHSDGVALSKQAWNNKFENLRKSRKGNPSYLSTEWLFATDFKSESDYITATNKGYFSTKDHKAGEKGGFANGPHLYFARQIGLDAKQSLEALNLGLGDLDDYQFLKKGKFDNREQAQDARERGFRFKKKYLAAMEMGCNSKDQYLAIVKHGWENLGAFKEAENVGFKPKEAELYKTIKETPIYRAYSNRIFSYSDVEALDIMRHYRTMVDFQHEAGYDKLWEAEVLDLLMSAEGKSVSYGDIFKVALETHSFEGTATEAQVLEYLIHDDQANKLGRAIPRDKVFEFLKSRQRREPIETD